jgi:hypothetical protein
MQKSTKNQNIDFFNHNETIKLIFSRVRDFIDKGNETMNFIKNLDDKNKNIIKYSIKTVISELVRLEKEIDMDYIKKLSEMYTIKEIYRYWSYTINLRQRSVLSDLGMLTEILRLCGDSENKLSNERIVKTLKIFLDSLDNLHEITNNIIQNFNKFFYHNIIEIPTGSKLDSNRNN